MLQFSMVWRYLTSGRKFFNLTSISAMIGIMLGVACLVVGMAVVSGFYQTLKKSVVDFSGHITVQQRGGVMSKPEKILELIRAELGNVEDVDEEKNGVKTTQFVHVEAMVAHNKKILGVLLEGVDEATVHQVLNLKERVVEGQFSLQAKEVDGRSVRSAVVGTVLAKNFNLKVGDRFRLVVPGFDEVGVTGVRAHSFFVSGIIDLGKYEYNERFIVADIHSARNLKGIVGGASGIKIRLAEELLDGKESLSQKTSALSVLLGYPFLVKGWKDLSRNLIEAVEIEKVVIFFVIFIIVIAACFNVSSHLFVSVLKHYSDISILKTLGASRVFIIQIFVLQGLAIGLMGALLGLAFGWLLSFSFSLVQKVWNILPGEIYKLDYIQPDFEFLDVFAIIIMSLLACFVSTLFPAIKGSRLKPVEGLQHE